jgi:hypothetical protein
MRPMRGSSRGVRYQVAWRLRELPGLDVVTDDGRDLVAEADASQAGAIGDLLGVHAHSERLARRASRRTAS